MVDNSHLEKLLRDNFVISSQYASGVDGDGNYSIENGIFEIIGSIKLRLAFSQTQIPINFGYVSGRFSVDIAKGTLTTLDGCPKVVGETFDCDNNKIMSLIGGPETVGGHYYCQHNLLTSLEGLPKEIKQSFIVTYSSHLPLLRLVTLNSQEIDIFADNDSTTSTNTLADSIINDHRRLVKAGTNIKEALWACQGALTKNGLGSNASW
jgi:hypothetical protein